MQGVMKPVAIIVAVLVAIIAVTLLNSSDLLNGGTCYRLAQGYGAAATGEVATTVAGETAVTAAGVGSVIASAKDPRACAAVMEDTAAADDGTLTANGAWEFDLDTFPGFRSLVMLMPLIIITLIIFMAWRSGGLGGLGGGARGSY